MGCKGGTVSRVFDYAKKFGLPNSECINYNPEFKEGDEGVCTTI